MEIHNPSDLVFDPYIDLSKEQVPLYPLQIFYHIEIY